MGVVFGFGYTLLLCQGVTFSFSFDSHMAMGDSTWFMGRAPQCQVPILPHRKSCSRVKHYCPFRSKLPYELVECLLALPPSLFVPSSVPLVLVLFLPIVVVVNYLGSAGESLLAAP